MDRFGIYLAGRLEGSGRRGECEEGEGEFKLTSCWGPAARERMGGPLSRRNLGQGWMEGRGCWEDRIKCELPLAHSFSYYAALMYSFVHLFQI